MRYKNNAFLENLIKVILTYSSGQSSSLFNVYSTKMTEGFNVVKSAKWLSSIGVFLNSITLKFQYVSLLLFFYYLTFERRRKI